MQITRGVYKLAHYEYLKQVFTELPKAKNIEDIEAMLPWNFVLQGGAD